MSAVAPLNAVAPTDETITISSDEYNQIKGQLLMLDTELTRLMSQPLIHATVVSAENNFNLEAFEVGDRVVILDKKVIKEYKHCGGWGKLASTVEDDGSVIVEFFNGDRVVLNIGLNDEVPQLKLVGKNDGTNVTIALNGNIYEVHGLPGVKFYPPDTVNVDMQSQQIHNKVDTSAGGDIAYVKTVHDDRHIEVETNGNAKIVISTIILEEDEKIEPGSKVMLDPSATMVTKLLKSDNHDQFNLNVNLNVDWSLIAGCEKAKDELKEAIETPYTHKEVYDFYKISTPKGVLLSGPPGCGKTLLAKAAATSLAKIHQREVTDSGFIYVKGPEILDKYVGNSEAKIRELFKKGRDHFDKHGYPALLFIDEADAIMPTRGSVRSSDVEGTIVPQFLSEMDGLEDNKVMVLLATNQPKRLDPAIIREGRVDRHVAVERPNEKNAHEYFNLYIKDVPLARGLHAKEVIDHVVAEIFSNKHVYSRVTYQKKVELFTFADTLSGAAIAGIVAKAKSYAMRRDIEAKKPKGVLMEDFLHAVQETVDAHEHLNTLFDLEDFCERHGFARSGISIEKLSK